MGVVYGITVAPENDRYITIAEKALEGMSKAANPGEFLVDIIPIRAICSSSWRVLLTLFPISEVHSVRGVHYEKLFGQLIYFSPEVNGFRGRVSKERPVSGGKQ